MNDYGYINGAYNTPIPNKQEKRHTQVYMATHKKKNRPKQQMCYGRLGRDNGTRTHDLCNVTAAL